MVAKAYDLALWILPHVAKMPRDHLFTLGERIEFSLLAILEHLVQASYTQRREALLPEAQRCLLACQCLSLTLEIQKVPAIHSDS